MSVSKATRLRDALSKKRMSQSALANLIDVPQASITRFKQGVSLPFEKMDKLFEVLEIDKDYFKETDIVNEPQAKYGLLDENKYLEIIKQQIINETKLIDNETRLIGLLEKLTRKL